MNNIDFKKEFIDVDFDNILLETNNPIINSYENYLKFKQSYLTTAQTNYEKFNELCSKFNEMNGKNFKKISDTKFIYTYIDRNEYINLKNNIKSIVIKQRELYQNFISYLNTINKKYQNKIEYDYTNNRNVFLNVSDNVDNISIKKKRNMNILKRLKLKD